jgi:hypothetical protein
MAHHDKTIPVEQPAARSGRALPIVCSFLLVALSACSSEPDASTSAGGQGVECPKDTLCLNVKAMSAGDLAEGRTAVMWYQLDDDSSDPVPVIGYEAAFDPSTSRIDIPLSSISPPDEGNLLCDRMCNDEAACPCLTDRKVGLGFVFVADDINKDGKLDGEEIFDSDYGYGYMALAYSEKAWIPSPSPDFDKIFPEGIDMGIRPYRVLAVDDYNVLGRTMGGEVLDLNVCPASDAECDPWWQLRWDFAQWD